MAYQTGTAATVDQLLQAIQAFAVNNGYTSHGDWTVGNSHFYGLQKGSEYFLLEQPNSSDTIRMDVASSISTGNGWGSQGVASGGGGNACYVYPINSPYTSYHLFSTAGNIFAAVECAPGQYNHLMLGVVTKVGSWTGGGFVAGGYYYRPSAWGYDFRSRYLLQPFSYDKHNATRASRVRITINGNNVAHISEEARAPTTKGYCQYVEDEGRFLLDRSKPNPFNRRAVMLQPQLFVKDETLDRWRPIGYIEGVRSLRIDVLNAKDVINTDWMVFPFGQKNGAGAYIWPSSKNYGVAYQQ